jgi:hypothetical protein
MRGPYHRGIVLVRIDTPVPSKDRGREFRNGEYPDTEAEALGGDAGRSAHRATENANMLSGARQARRGDPAAVTGAKYEDGLVIIDLYNWRG